jgi:hypothetical protein
LLVASSPQTAAGQPTFRRPGYRAHRLNGPVCDLLSLVAASFESGPMREGVMQRYIVDLDDTTSASAFVRALRHDFRDIRCINSSIYMFGAHEQEQLILDHAVATDTKVNHVMSFHETKTDKAQRWVATTLTPLPATVATSGSASDDIL